MNKCSKIFGIYCCILELVKFFSILEWFRRMFFVFVYELGFFFYCVSKIKYKNVLSIEIDKRF